jgi:hypothetical protein
VTAAENGRPQAWDAVKVRAAADLVLELAAELESDRSGEAYRAKLETTIVPIFDEVETQQQAAERLAYLLYGACLLVSGATAAAEALAHVDRQQVLAIVSRSVAEWLENPDAFG